LKKLQKLDTFTCGDKAWLLCGAEVIYRGQNGLSEEQKANVMVFVEFPDGENSRVPVSIDDLSVTRFTQGEWVYFKEEPQALEYVSSWKSDGKSPDCRGVAVGSLMHIVKKAGNTPYCPTGPPYSLKDEYVHRKMLQPDSDTSAQSSTKAPSTTSNTVQSPTAESAVEYYVAKPVRGTTPLVDEKLWQDLKDLEELTAQCNVLMRRRLIHRLATLEAGKPQNTFP